MKSSFLKRGDYSDGVTREKRSNGPTKGSAERVKLVGNKGEILSVISCAVEKRAKPFFFPFFHLKSFHKGDIRLVLQ